MECYACHSHSLLLLFSLLPTVCGNVALRRSNINGAGVLLLDVISAIREERGGLQRFSTIGLVGVSSTALLLLLGGVAQSCCTTV
mmetsp:Transcript_38520/g.89541  ORF Transcript_38520/g.89541 Transcript_38520/m.89541 type:complete len:85 (+) Transcript_38520:496-750(+)